MIVDTCHRLMMVAITDNPSAAATSGISPRSAHVEVQTIDHNMVCQKWVTDATKQTGAKSV